jgi:hypothetical protein
MMWRQTLWFCKLSSHMSRDTGRGCTARTCTPAGPAARPWHMSPGWGVHSFPHHPVGSKLLRF